MPRCNVDEVAQFLQRLGSLAKRMPPSWRGGGVHHTACGPNGEVIGRILPGEGLYLDCDAKYLGITKKLPNVIERTPMRRVLDRALDERGSITSMAAFQQAIQGGQSQTVQMRVGATPGTQWIDSWANTPWVGAPGNNNPLAYPNGGTTLDQTVAGALNQAMIAPSGSNTMYLLSVGINKRKSTDTAPAGYNLCMLVDGLVSYGGLTLTITTPQTLTGLPSLPRYTSGVGVMHTVEGTFNNNFGASTYTISYTNQAGTIGQTATTTLNGQSNVGTLLGADGGGNSTPFGTFASGDYGVQSIASFTTNVAQGVGSTAQILIYYPLAIFPCTSGEDDYFEIDFVSQMGGPIPLATSSGNLGSLQLLQYTVTANEPSDSTVVLKTVQG